MSSFCHAQQPGWLWGVNCSNSDDDAANAITHDKQGNIYVAGSFKGVQILGNDTLVSRGDNDVFLVKYTTDGQVLWARSGGSVARESVKALTIDTNGNVYLTGSFGEHNIYSINYTDTAYFSDSTIISNSRRDAFLVSYDSIGNIRWTKGYGSEFDDIGTSLVCNSHNEIIIGGEFGYGGLYGSIKLDSIVLTSPYSQNIFLASINTNGIVNWFKRLGNTSIELCRGISVDKNDYIYMTGLFGDYTILGSINLQGVSTGFVGGNIFVAKFEPTGNAIWAKCIGGNNNGTSTGGNVYSSTIRASLNGDIYVAGGFRNCNLVFPNITTLPNQGANEIFLAKYDTWGNLLWAKSMGGLSDDGPPFIYLDDQEHCYVTGYVRYQAFFDQDTVTCYGFNDVFLAKYDKNGNANWAVNMGGGGSEEALAIDGSADGSIYLAGSFNSDYFNYQSDNIQNSGGGDMFLVKLSKPNGIENLPESKPIVEIFPNPAQHMVHIQSNTKFDHIKIIDALGSVVTEQQYTTPQHQADIDLSGLPNNYYYLILNNKKQFVASKMISVNH